VERRVDLQELVAASPHFDESDAALLEPGVAVTRRRTSGGAGPEVVAVQMDRFRSRLATDRRRLAD